MYGLTNLTQPAVEPVQLADVKTHLRISSSMTADDVLLGYWITAARSLAERHTNNRWITQQIRLTLEAWPGPWPWSMGAHAAFVGHVPPPLIYHDDVRRHLLFLSGGYPVRIPTQPVQSIDSISYYDFVGNVQTLSPSLYQAWLDYSPPVVAPAPQQVWPALQVGRLAPVTIEFTAGWGDDATSVPPEVIPAILLTVGYWYENRGDGTDPTMIAGMPQTLGLPVGAKRLLDMIATGGYV